MPCEVVLGGQWGDEGKGKIVDWVAAGAHAVVRCQGGANAGHTLVFGDRRVALHLVPSGVREPECLMVLGNGMVIDPIAFLEEITGLEAAGFVVRPRLRVSTAAHLVLPAHRLQDRVQEERRGAAAVGTTGRGIGPAYADKAARSGVPAGVFARPEAELGAVLRQALEAKRTELGSGVTMDVDGMCADLVRCREIIAPMLCDTADLLHGMWRDGRRIVLEGAQGALLDLDHGSYPYVTSSSCTSAGALVGSGLPPQAITSVLGVVKAYATRVGNGPFSTELQDATGERLRDLGSEYGATTGRPRRCGWFDAVAVRRAAAISGFTGLALTKLDVLDEFEHVRVGIGYELDGRRLDRMPAETLLQARCTPVYLDVEGWRRSTRECRTWEDLPHPTRGFVEVLEEHVGVPVEILSVGADRDRTFRIARRTGRSPATASPAA